MRRSRLNCFENDEKDLRKMTANMRRQKAVDRKKWASVVCEAKSLRDP
jgi:hypothetical protein